MKAEKRIRIEHDGVVLKIPKSHILRNFAESLQRPVEFPLQVVSAGKPRIGEYWHGQGGIYAGDMRGTNGAPDYALIVATGDRAYNESIAWGGRGKSESGATCEWDGAANTRALLASSHDHPAAKWASEFEADGHQDFYLGARREMRLAWVNVPELFSKKWHWTSTQSSEGDAWVQYFGDGGQYFGGKGSVFAVRPVRRVSY